MGFIGKQPTPVPLTASDITDGIISTDKLASNAVTSAKITDGSIATADIADSAVTKAKTTGVVSDPFRNLIINGDMSISQRATSKSSITGNGYHTLDRYHLNCDTMGTWTMSQSTDVPTGQGFAKSLKLDCTTADASPASADQLKIQIKLEGQNLQFLKKGTSSAVSTTLSFWVRSYKTGTYIARLEDTDNSRNISKSYTISSADTWEKKEITFAGDTTGTLTNDFNNSLVVELILGAGSDFTSGTLNTSWNSTTNANVAVGQVNLADNTANDFYVTGIQLEAGTSASDFEFLPHTVNLKRCQRYCEKIDKSTTESVICLGQGTGGSSVFGRVYFETAKRVVPSGTISAASDIQVLTGSASAWSTASGASVQAGDERTMRLALTGLSGMTTGGCHEVRINASDGSIIYDAEI